MTDLESEVNKAGFYEKNQYGLHRTLSCVKAESLHDECSVTPAISLHGEPLDLVNSLTGTYHNLYAIIIVVTAFIAMESRKLAVARNTLAFESDRPSSLGIDIQMRSPTITPGSEYIQQKETASRKLSIDPWLQSTE